MLTVKTFIFNPLNENTYLVFNEDKECVILDPGCYSKDERKILQDYISEHGLILKYLLNTHCHLDHVLGNKFIHEAYGLILHIHPKEQAVLQYAPLFAANWGLTLDNYEGPLLFLEEGDIIKLGSDELEVLFTPGHAPGHIAFYCRQQGFVIAGDVLFKGSIGRTDLPMGSFETLISSIKNKLFKLPDDTIVYPGHGEYTIIGQEKLHNPYLI
ncbi:MAG: MBL fold metallo-hydrolase [Chitinophagaceae bacterium]|nr:MBL fold metallo-hydrolase [Chitinophagaceae bacterium]